MSFMRRLGIYPSSIKIQVMERSGSLSLSPWPMCSLSLEERKNTCGSHVESSDSSSQLKGIKRGSFDMFTRNEPEGRKSCI